MDSDDETAGDDGIADTMEEYADPDELVGTEPKTEIMDSSNLSGGTQALAERTTTPFMTKYEKARVLGTRALQISMNAPVMVDVDGEIDPLKIAAKELREKKVPMIVRRYLPDGCYEDWPVHDLIID